MYFEILTTCIRRLDSSFDMGLGCVLELGIGTVGCMDCMELVGNFVEEYCRFGRCLFECFAVGIDVVVCGSL